MQEQRVKIWIGLGAFVLGGAAGTAGAAMPDTDTAARPAITRDGGAFVPAAPGTMTAIQVAQEGEGGEGGEGGAKVAQAPSFALTHFIRTAEARLRVGMELLAAGHQADAVSHFKRVVRYLEDKNAKGFEKSAGFRRAHALKEAKELVELAGKKGSRAKIDHVYEEILEDFDNVLVKVNPATRRSADLALDLAIAQVKHAAHEYEDAVKDGKVVNKGDYQAARAFVWIGRDIFGQAAAELSARHDGRTGDIIAAFNELQAALKSLQPPAKPESSAKIASLVAKIELEASGLRRATSAMGVQGGEGGEGGEGGKGG